MKSNARRASKASGLRRTSAAAASTAATSPTRSAADVSRLRHAPAHHLEQAHRGRRRGVERFHAARHRDRHAQRRRARAAPRDKPGALVADRDAPAAAQRRVEQRDAAARRPSRPRSPPRARNAARPRRQVDVLDDRRSGSARPARRAAPSATTRTRSASTAAPARRRRPPPCAASSRRCRDPARRRAAGRSRAGARQRGARRRHDGQHADAGRQRGELGEQRRAARPDVARAACARPAPRSAGRAERIVDDEQRLGRADAVEVDGDEVLAFEHALAGLAPVARRRDEPRGFAAARGFWRDVTRCMRSRAGRASALGPARAAGGTGAGAVAAGAVPRLQLEEHLVLADHAELRARALLDRLGAGLEVAHVGVERVVARLELGVGLALRAELAVESRAPAASRPCRATSDTAARRSARRRRARASARDGSSTRC